MDCSEPGLAESWPGLSRPSTPYLLKFRKEDVDSRDTRGHDDGECFSVTCLPLRARIGLARFMQITHAFFVAFGAHVDIRIFGALADSSRADFEIDGIAAAAVDKAMAVGDAGLEAGRVAGPQHHLAVDAAGF